MKDEYKKLYKRRETPEAAFDRIIEITKVLRQECPWDRKQTHESLTKCMIEEAYEVVEAINEKDMANLREELGDVMLQVIFHGILAEEEKEFNITDLTNDICEKMIRRHPHIFLEEDIKTIDKVLEKWENVKSEEHGDSMVTDRLERVPKALPSLMRSFKVQSKASQIGFDFMNADEAVHKIEEELKELHEAIASGESDKVNEELGDLLFSAVNAARMLDIDPEKSLNESTSKFIRRFAIMENLSMEEDHSLTDLGFDEMDRLWNKAKRIVSSEE